MPTNPIIHNGPLNIDQRAANFHPEQWDSAIFEYKPFAAAATLTAFLTRLGSETTQSRKFNWAYQGYNGLSGSALRAKTNVTLATDYTYNAGTSTGTAGSILYLPMTAANAKIARPYDLIKIGAAEGKTVAAEILSTNIANDTTSYYTIRMLEADTGNILAGTALYFTVFQRAEDEITELPPGQTEEAVWLDNYAGMMMESTEMSWAEIKELERVSPNVRKRNVDRALHRLLLRRERAILMGTKRVSGRRHYSGGLEYWLKSAEGGNGENVYDLRNDAAYSGKVWMEDGLDILMDISEKLSRFSDASEKWVACGSEAMTAINKAVFNNTTYNIERLESGFGIRIKQLNGLNQDWNLFQSAVLTTDPLYRKTMVVCEPELMTLRTYFPLTLVPGSGLAELAKANGHTFVTSDKTGWFVQEGLKINNFSAHAWISNVGVDNVA